MKGSVASVLGILGLCVALAFALPRGNDRDIAYDTKDLCRSMRFHATPEQARDIAARSGGHVVETPSGFTLRFERHYLATDVGCVVEIDKGRVVRVDFERFPD